MNAGDRPGVPNVAIILTDGEPNRKTWQTNDAAKALKDKATVIAVTNVSNLSCLFVFCPLHVCLDTI